MSQAGSCVMSCLGKENKENKASKAGARPEGLKTIMVASMAGIRVSEGQQCEQRGGERNSRGPEQGGPCKPCGRTLAFTPSHMGSHWRGMT